MAFVTTYEPRTDFQVGIEILASGHSAPFIAAHQRGSNGRKFLQCGVLGHLSPHHDRRGNPELLIILFADIQFSLKHMEDHAFDSSAFVGTGNTGVHGINR